ncbi:MAG: adenosylhomocysteinase [Clostridia bacterium]|nr:adenosylhomocysteinase [Clostridia bacterium]
MSAIERSTLRHPEWAAEGRRKIEWAEAHMPVLAQIRERFRSERPLAGETVAICLHLEAKTANLALAVQDAGARVVITGSNPLSTQDDVAAGLASLGVEVHSWHGCTPQEYRSFLDRVLDAGPTLLIDDGGDLVARLHTERRDRLGGVRGGCEETTTGILRLAAMDREGRLSFPMVGVNNARMKYLMDNQHGTGQSVWDGIMRTTNLLVAGKTVVVVGYGWCGRGVARRAQGLGARVVAVEVDPFAANVALLDGCEVMTGEEAAAVGDIFVTTTGNRAVLTRRHFERMKDGAILANAGHFDVEIDLPALAELAAEVYEARANVRAYRMPDGRRLYLLAEGRLVNLAAADGHPAEIMDMTFALQALALRYVHRESGRLGPHLVEVPREIDEEVARLRLAAAGAGLDELSDAQREYLNSWSHE